MFRNYLAAVLRNLWRSRLYAGIGVASLTVGFTTALFSFLFVRDEMSYDRFIPGYEQVYRVSMSLKPGDGSRMNFEGTTSEMAAWLKLSFPSIEAATRFDISGGSLGRGEVESDEAVSWADPNFFAVFPLKTIAGDLKTALSQPDGIVLTRSLARKYFGRDAPIGEPIELNREHVMRVTAVLEDLPSSTHLNLGVIASARASFSRLTALDKQSDQSGLSITTLTYFRIKQGAGVEAIQRELPAFRARHWGADKAQAIGVEVLPITAIHLHPAGIGAMKPAGDRSTVYAVAASGMLVVLAAGFNFINLVMARVVGRGIEVGVRKVCGARRRELVVQFLGEALLYVVAAMIAAMALVELLLPHFNSFLDRTIQFQYWTNIYAIGGMIILIIAASVLVGIYPALILSSFKPVVALQGRLIRSDGSTIRQLLVAIQFCILIGLLIATGVIQRQMTYATQERLRLNQDSVLLVASGCQSALKESVRALAGVRDAVCSCSAPVNTQISSSGVRGPNGEDVVLSYDAVDFGFFELYGLRPVAGRFFEMSHGMDAVRSDEVSPFFTTDTNGIPLPKDRKQATQLSVVINESAARKLGFKTPATSIGQTFVHGDSETANAIRPTIIGVVSDFPVQSIREPIRPTAYVVDARVFSMLSIKLSGQNVPETLRAIDQLWRKIGPPRPIKRSFLDEYTQRLYQDIIRQERVFEIFSGLAIFVACLGLFGLAAFNAERRTKEIGIRKAMGAGTADLMRLLVWQFTTPVLWANLIAWPVAAFVMNRWLQGFAYHVSLSPWLFFGATGIALVVALLTVSIHCYLVARAKPVAALRYE